MEPLRSLKDYIGLLPYVAPEQIMGESYASVATDVYSLAVIIYELLTGIQPFAKPTLGETRMAVLFEPPPRAGNFNPQLTSGIETVLSRALSKEPKRRYWSARHFCEDLSATTLPETAESDVTATQDPTPIAKMGKWRITLDGEC